MIEWGYRENKKNAKVKRAQFTPDHHEINLNKESSAGELLRFNRVTAHSNMQEMNNTEDHS